MAKFFVTGGSGYIGSEVIKSLVSHKHSVVALARSDASAEKVRALGAEPLKGDLTDLDVLKKGASESDGVLHLGYIHDFPNFQRSIDVDTAAVKAFEEALTGSNKVFIWTGGLLNVACPIGSDTKDETTVGQVGPGMGQRTLNEHYTLGLKGKGIKAMVIRLSPTVHGKDDPQFMSHFSKAFQKLGYSAYIGEGKNVWPAVHRLDAAKLYTLAAEKGSAGDVYHAASELIEFKSIAEAFSKHYGFEAKSLTSEEAGPAFGFLGHAMAANAPATAELTKKKLGWEPTQASLIDDILAGYY